MEPYEESMTMQEKRNWAFSPEATGPEGFPHAILADNDVVAWAKSKQVAEYVSRCCKENPELNHELDRLRNRVLGLENQLRQLSLTAQKLREPLCFTRESLNKLNEPISAIEQGLSAMSQIAGSVGSR